MDGWMSYVFSVRHTACPGILCLKRLEVVIQAHILLHLGPLLQLLHLPVLDTPSQTSS